MSETDDNLIEHLRMHEDRMAKQGDHRGAHYYGAAADEIARLHQLMVANYRIVDDMTAEIARLRMDASIKRNCLEAEVVRLQETLDGALLITDKLRAALEWIEQNSNEQDIAAYAGRAAEGEAARQ